MSHFDRMKMGLFDRSNYSYYNVKKLPDNERKLGQRISIEFIDHKDQRYDTVGDYFQSGQLGEVIIRVSKMKDERYQMLVAVHELVELILCRDAGISDQEIDQWDMNFKGDGEPGEHMDAPYWRQHLFATTVEKRMAEIMGIDWKEYDDYIAGFSQDPPSVGETARDIPPTRSE